VPHGPRLTAARRVLAVVLAAGRAERFGSDKLLHQLDGRPLGEHIAATLAGLPLTARIAVCPTGNSARRDLFVAHQFDIVENPYPERGMGASLALGAQAAIAHDADALLVCLADMPYVMREHLTALMGIDAPAATTECNGTRSPPAIFSRALFAELSALTGDTGARELLRTATTLDADASLVRDFDTPADFG
jgi:molybdenum cofactor cytidylyltransferase